MKMTLESPDIAILASMQPGILYQFVDIWKGSGIKQTALRKIIDPMVKSGALMCTIRAGARFYSLPGSAIATVSAPVKAKPYVQRGAAWDRVNERLAEAREIKSKFD